MRGFLSDHLIIIIGAAEADGEYHVIILKDGYERVSTVQGGLTEMMTGFVCSHAPSRGL